MGSGSVAWGLCGDGVIWFQGSSLPEAVSIDSKPPATKLELKPEVANPRPPQSSPMKSLFGLGFSMTAS